MGSVNIQIHKFSEEVCVECDQCESELAGGTCAIEIVVDGDSFRHCKKYRCKLCRAEKIALKLFPHERAAQEEAHVVQGDIVTRQSIDFLILEPWSEEREQVSAN